MDLTKEEIDKLGDFANFLCPLCYFTASKRVGIRRHLKSHCKEDATGMGYFCWEGSPIDTLNKLEAQSQVENKGVL
jgi:hypothetical protein